jgi:hypothetical protein
MAPATSGSRRARPVTRGRLNPQVSARSWRRPARTEESDSGFEPLSLPHPGGGRIRRRATSPRRVMRRRPSCQPPPTATSSICRSATSAALPAPAETTTSSCSRSPTAAGACRSGSGKRPPSRSPSASWATAPKLPRPLASDLTARLVQALGGNLREVRIDRLTEGTYYAVIVIDGPQGTAEVDARPSDALAPAWSSGRPSGPTAPLSRPPSRTGPWRKRSPPSTAKAPPAPRPSSTR